MLSGSQSLSQSLGHISISHSDKQKQASLAPAPEEAVLPRSGPGEEAGSRLRPGGTTKLHPDFSLGCTPGSAGAGPVGRLGCSRHARAGAGKGSSPACQAAGWAPLPHSIPEDVAPSRWEATWGRPSSANRATFLPPALPSPTPVLCNTFPRFRGREEEGAPSASQSPVSAASPLHVGSR